MATCRVCAICDVISNVVNLSGHVPALLYVTDFRLVFILTAIYTSLVAQFRQAANQEAETDIHSGRMFRINSEWTNHSITGGVSDRILWTCRADSSTDSYYKTLYLGLIIIYFVIVWVYFIVRVIMTCLIAHVAWKLEFGEKGRLRNRRMRYLELVGNGLKSLDQYSCNVTEAFEDAIDDEQLSTENYSEKFKELNSKLKKLKDESDEKWNRLTQQSNFLYNWFAILFVIPRCETLIMLLILSLTLTSYDIHPLGCLSPIDVLYSEAETSVTLTISKNVVGYQRGSVILSLVLAIFWLLVKVFHFCLLPRVGWGLLISKSQDCCALSKWSVTACYLCISWYRESKSHSSQNA